MRHQHVAFGGVADGRLVVDFLDLASHGQRFVPAAHAHGQLDLGETGGDQVRLQVDGALQVLGRSVIVLHQHVHTGEAQVRRGRFRGQVDQLAVGFQRAGRVLVGDLGLAQQFHQFGIGRVGGLDLACQRQRLLSLSRTQVVPAEVERRADRFRLRIVGLLEPRRRFFGMILHHRQVAEGTHRVDVVRFLLQDFFVALLGDVGFLLDEVQARQVLDGRDEGRLQGHGLVQRGARGGHVALDHVDGAPQGQHLRIVGLLLFEGVDGGQRLVVMLEADFRLDQRHRGLRRLRVELRGLLQFGQATCLVALGQLGQAERGTQAGRLGCQRRGFFQVDAGFVEVTHLHIGFAGQGEHLRIVRRVLQCRRERRGGIVRLRALELGLGQQLAGIDVVRIEFEVFAQVLVGLLQCAEVQFRCAGQQHAGHVVRRDFQDALQGILSRRVLALREFVQRAGVRHEQIAWRILLGRIDFGFCVRELAAGDVNVCLLDVRRAMVRIQRQRLVVGDDRLVGLALRAQQRAARHEDIRILRILGHGLVDVTRGRVLVLLGDGVARQAEQGVTGIGVQRQGLLERLLGFVELAGGQQGVAAQRQQRRRFGGHFRRDFVEDFLELALLRHRPGQLGQHAVGGDPIRAGLAEFLLGRGEIAHVELEVAQLHARLAVFRALFDRILKLNHCRLQVAFLLILLGFSQQLLGRLRGAAAGGQPGDHERAGQDGSGKFQLVGVTRHLAFLEICIVTAMVGGFLFNNNT